MTSVVCIGTSDAFGSGGRRQSSYAVCARQGTLLLDCGGTTPTGLEQVGISREEVDGVVVSHFHGDHFSGIPQLLLAACYLDGRRRAFQVAGPRGVEGHVRQLADALGYPIDHRDLGYRLDFQELDAGVPVPLGPFQVETFETFHAPEASPHGILCRVDGKSVAYSGDTGWYDALPKHVNGADLFLCECTQDRRAYQYHLSLEELTANRDRLECGRIVLTHLGLAMRSRSEHAGFEIADDGLVLEL